MAGGALACDDEIARAAVRAPVSIEKDMLAVSLDTRPARARDARTRFTEADSIRIEFLARVVMQPSCLSSCDASLPRKAAVLVAAALRNTSQANSCYRARQHSTQTNHLD